MRLPRPLKHAYIDPKSNIDYGTNRSGTSFFQPARIPGIAASVAGTAGGFDPASVGVTTHQVQPWEWEPPEWMRDIYQRGKQYAGQASELVSDTVARQLYPFVMGWGGKSGQMEKLRKEVREWGRREDTQLERPTTQIRRLYTTLARQQLAPQNMLTGKSQIHKHIQNLPGESQFEKLRYFHTRVAPQLTRNLQEYGSQLRELRDIYSRWGAGEREGQDFSRFLINEEGQLDPDRLRRAATELLPTLKENLPSQRELKELGLNREKARRIVGSLGLSPETFSEGPEKAKKDIEFAGKVFDSFREGLGAVQKGYWTPQGPVSLSTLPDTPAVRQTRRTLNQLATSEGQKQLREILGGAGEAMGQDPLEYLKSQYTDKEDRFQEDKFEADVPKMAGALGNAWNLMEQVGRVFSPEQIQEMGLTPREFMKSHMRKSGKPDWEAMNNTVRFWDQALRVFKRAGPGFKEDFVNVMQLGDRLQGIGILGKGSDIISEVGRWFFDDEGNLTNPTLFRALVKVGSFAEQSWEALMEEKDPKAWLSVLAGGLSILGLIKHFITPSPARRVPAAGRPAPAQPRILPAQPQQRGQRQTVIPPEEQIPIRSGERLRRHIYSPHFPAASR